MKLPTLLMLPACSVVLATVSALAQPSVRPNVAKPGVPHAINDITQPKISPAAAAMIPDDGFWFAGLTSYNTGDGDSEFYIYQITKTGVKAVFSEAHNRSLHGGWQDAHTFVIADFSDNAGNIQVRSFRDGALARTIIVKPADWKLPANVKTPEMPDVRFAGSTLWLEECIKFTETMHSRCLKTAAVKIDGDKITSAKAAPKSARSGNVRLTAPTIKAPRTPPAPSVTARKFAIEDTKVRGIDCKLNDTATTWPTAATINWQFAPQVKKVTWHSAIPPLFSVTGPATNPINEVTTVTRTFHGCSAEPMDRFVWLGNGLWAEAVVHSFADGPVSHTTWHVYAGAEPIAVLLASQFSFFQAPQR